MIISVCNQKGGVSKTTTTFNAAAALIELGYSVCLWDADLVQGDLQLMAQAAGIPCQIPTAFNLGYQIAAHPADFHLIDTPPRDDAAMLRALSVSDVALVTVPAEFLTIRGLTRLYHTFTASQTNNPNLQLKGVVTMYSSNYSAAKNQLRALQGFVFCKTVLPRMKVVSDSPAVGQSVLTFAENSKAARAYRLLAKEIEKW